MLLFDFQICRFAGKQFKFPYVNRHPGIYLNNILSIEEKIHIKIYIHIVIRVMQNDVRFNHFANCKQYRLNINPNRHPHRSQVAAVENSVTHVKCMSNIEIYRIHTYIWLSYLQQFVFVFLPHSLVIVMSCIFTLRIIVEI